MSNEVAGIILAGGGSTRLGHPKQLLDWFGTTFVNQVIDTAFTAKLKPVILVTGANFAEIEKSILRTDVIIARNSNWNNGQSSSIIAGINALGIEPQPFIILLCDQPQVPAELLIALINKYHEEKSEIVITKVGKRNCPPILFDPVCKTELLKLEGDKGGKELVIRKRTSELVWNDRRVIMDADTKEDYEQLIETFK
jgi:molybdenum cofactor cytidylyltransferase